MKKRIFLLAAIIMGIVLITVILGSISNKDKNEFPHSKQIMLKVEGGMNVVKDKTFNMTFIFIDEYALSEMSSSDNIKEIQIHEKGNVVKVNKWQINEIERREKYVIRKVDIEGKIDKEGEYSLDQLSLLYKDHKIEKFDIGNFELICKREDEYLNKAYTMLFNTERIPNKDGSNKLPFSTLGLFVKNFEDKDVIIKKIDLGIKTLGIDKKKFSYQAMQDDINKIYAHLEDEANSGKQGNNIGEVTIVDNLENEITPVKIPSINTSQNENNQGTLIVIPIAMKEPENEIKLYVLNTKLYLDVAGEEKIVFRYEPEIILPVIKNSYEIEKLLEEKGI